MKIGYLIYFMITNQRVDVAKVIAQEMKVIDETSHKDRKPLTFLGLIT